MSSATVILGVDPGLKGALAFWCPESELLEAFTMPTLKVEKLKRGKKRKGSVIDGYAIAHIVRDRASALRKAYVELVGSRPQQGVASTATFMKSTGIVLGEIMGNLIPMEEVSPAKWKRHMGVTADKETSLRRASALLPRYAKLWGPDAGDMDRRGGIAEAVLLALYGARQP